MISDQRQDDSQNIDAEGQEEARRKRRDREQQGRADELKAEQIERQRKEQLIKFFYGAAAQVTIREFPGFAPFARVETKTGPDTGARVTIHENKITLHQADAASMIATLLLAEAMLGKSLVANGPKSFQLTAIAYGLALGVSVEGKDQARFTEKDKESIGEMVKSLQASGVAPTDPRKQKPRSVQLWPKQN